jgi:hypothetical protein
LRKDTLDRAFSNPFKNKVHAHKSRNDESEDSLRQAYGRKVQELLSQSDAATWINNLWQHVHRLHDVFVQEAGYDPRGHNRFVSFKELVFFFQDVEQISRTK